MKKRTILVVEDNKLNLKLVVALLAMKHHQVLTASDAEQGIQLALEHQPDLILMDLQLPKMDGLTATRHILADPLLESIPVVALTSHAMEGDKEKALKAGCSGYISKPIDTRVFEDTISAFFNNGGGSV